MTNDRIPYAKKSTLPRRFFSLVSPLHTPSTLILFIPPARVCFEYTYNAVHRSLAPLALALCVSLSLSISFSRRVISYPLRYYERACNGNRRMIHGDVKRDGSRCRLETQSLPIREQPMPREKSGISSLLLIKILKRQSIKRVDVGKSSQKTSLTLVSLPVINGY